MTDDATIQPLTIHLARPSFTDEKDLVKTDSRIKHFRIEIEANTVADLYIQPPTEKRPEWVEFFDGYISPDEFGKNSSTGAALLVKSGSGIYAITFGSTGRFLLNEHSWEERFGLKVALNCIGGNTVRSIDKHSLDQILRHSSEQASRDATPGEFGFDIEQDLLKGVTGKPIDKRYGERMSGADSLHISTAVHLNRLPELLEDIRAKFIDTSYQKTFPWVDQIAEVRNAGLEQDLDTLLVNQINSGARDRIWMAVPERITWQRVVGFRFPARGGTFEYQDVHMDHFLKATGLPIEKGTLIRRTVECLDHDGRKLHRWPAYKCVYAEIEHEHKVFLLSGGTWYSVESNFIEQVNTAFQRIPDYEAALPEFKDNSEGEYLKRIAGEDPAKIALTDQKLIQYGGNKVEFCDLYSANDMFHVKRYGQASALSHLFAQGVVSGESFQMDADFRHAVNAILPQAFQIPDSDKRPSQGQYRVIFAIVSDRPGSLRLPFFSRLNMKHAVKRLEIAGFRVAKAKIAVDGVFSKTARLKRKIHSQ